MRTTILPMSELQFKPAFWGFDRDLKDVMERLESVWEGDTRVPEFHETDKAYIFMMDMPGVNKKDLDLQIEDDMVTITGKRKMPFGDEKNSIAVSRNIRVPKNVNREQIQANCVDGVLYLAFPKEEKIQPKKIKIGDVDDNSWKKLLGAFKPQ